MCAQGCGGSISVPNNGFPVKVNLRSRTAWSGLQPEIETWNSLSVIIGKMLSPFQVLNPAVLFLNIVFANGLCTLFQRMVS